MLLQRLLVNSVARNITAAGLKGVLANINAQYTNGHVDPLSKVKVLHQKDLNERPRGLAAWVGVVRYISTD